MRYGVCVAAVVLRPRHALCVGASLARVVGPGPGVARPRVGQARLPIRGARPPAGVPRPWAAIGHLPRGGGATVGPGGGTLSGPRLGFGAVSLARGAARRVVVVVVVRAGVGRPGGEEHGEAGEDEGGRAGHRLLPFEPSFTPQTRHPRRTFTNIAGAHANRA